MCYIDQGGPGRHPRWSGTHSGVQKWLNMSCLNFFLDPGAQGVYQGAQGALQGPSLSWYVLKFIGKPYYIFFICPWAPISVGSPWAPGP